MAWYSLFVLKVPLNPNQPTGCFTSWCCLLGGTAAWGRGELWWGAGIPDEATGSAGQTACPIRRCHHAKSQSRSLHIVDGRHYHLSPLLNTFSCGTTVRNQKPILPVQHGNWHKSPHWSQIFVKWLIFRDHPTV